jgi:hypothetical protein
MDIDRYQGGYHIHCHLGVCTFLLRDLEDIIIVVYHSEFAGPDFQTNIHSERVKVIIPVMRPVRDFADAAIYLDILHIGTEYCIAEVHRTVNELTGANETE